MAAFALPKVPRRLFPPDGRWHATDFWRDSVATLIDPTAAAAVTAGLLTVFEPEWAAAVPDQPHAPHPFEYGYGLGDGIPRLVRLGYCLHLLGGLPSPVHARLRSPSEFDEAEAEVRASALFARFGASITWSSDPRPPAFEAVWSDARIPVAVEQLADDGADRSPDSIDAAFERGLSDGLAGSLRESETRHASRAVLSPPLDELAPLVDAEDGPAMAHQLGEAYGKRWGELVASAGPGQHPSPGLLIEIVRDGHGHRWEASSLAPGAQVDFARLCRNRLELASRQMPANGRAGVVILERRWFPTWWPPVIELVAQALNRGCHPSLGAVILREADRDPNASRTAELLHVLAGPRWLNLPRQLHEQLSPGSHHVDLLPEQARGFDRSRLDDQDSARASTPAARLAEALQLMRIGLRMRWSRLRREHPSASTEDLHQMMLEWSRNDA